MGIYIFIITNYWYYQFQHENQIHDDKYDKFWNETIFFLSSQYMDRKKITYFMLITFLIIYLFDIYCSMYYGFIYLKFNNYVRYNSMRQNGKDSENEKQSGAQDFDNNSKQIEKKAVMHINKSIISTNSVMSDPTVSIMSLQDNEYKEYNPHIHADIATLKVNEFKENPMKNIRHYSLFEDETKEQKFDVANLRESSYSVGSKRAKNKKMKNRRKRSHSESDLRRSAMLKSIDSEFISPIKRIKWNEEKQCDEEDYKTQIVMELREKVNFLKATLFAKQSCLDRFKLDLNEQSFFIQNMSMKIKRMESEKQELEQQVLDKNDELDEKDILLQVAEGTKIELNKERSRLSHKLQQLTKSVSAMN